MGAGNRWKEKILQFLTEETAKNGFPPSVREVAQALGFKSPSSVHTYLRQLQAEGRVEEADGRKRAWRPVGMRVETKVPLLGRVAAGQPLLAVEMVEEYLPFAPDRQYAEPLFALRVQGDSMQKIGILDGDIVIVRKTPVAAKGDIVVALVEDEATVKRFSPEKNGVVRLLPENDSYQPLVYNIKDTSVSILGQVVANIRYYQ